MVVKLEELFGTSTMFLLQKQAHLDMAINKISLILNLLAFSKGKKLKESLQDQNSILLLIKIERFTFGEVENTVLSEMEVHQTIMFQLLMSILSTYKMKKNW